MAGPARARSSITIGNGKDLAGQNVDQRDGEEAVSFAGLLSQLMVVFRSRKPDSSEETR